MGYFDIYLSVTTDGSGDGTATATKSVAAWLEKIDFIDGDLADAHTAVLSVTSKPFGCVDETIWSTTAGDTNSDVSRPPRVQCVDASNDSIAGQYERPFITGKLKLTIASGGATKTGGCVLHLFD